MSTYYTVVLQPDAMRAIAVQARPLDSAATFGSDAGRLTNAFRRAKFLAGWKNDELRLPGVPA